MSTTADQLRRLLSFLPQIADGNEHPIAEIATRLGVESSTILADLHALSERWGDPPGWVQKVHLYVEAEHVSMEAPRHFRRPMRLTADESRAIELGLLMLRSEAAPDERGSIERALTKIREQIANHDQPAADTMAASSGTDAHTKSIAPLRSAMRARKKVEITYHKGSDDEPDKRTVCPFSFAVEKGAWYLVAHCDRSEGIRIFRLDRIVDLHVLSDSFDRPKGWRVEEVLADGRAFVGPALETMRVRYSPKVARWVSEREQGVAQGDGTLEVDYPMADPEWAVRHVLQYGPEAEVLSPDSLRQAITTRLTQLQSA